jgi:cysteine desulfurase/selenocysteine lyase
VVAFKAAIEFIQNIGRENIAAHEQDLLHYATERLQKIKGITLVGTAVRTGHHCTQPLMECYGIEGTVRASFAVYNTKAEIDKLAEGLERVIAFMQK